MATTTNKPLKVRVHFNRINMQRGDKRVWTVHTSKACYQVEKIVSLVELATVYNENGRQPRAYLGGKACVHIDNNTAYLTKTCVPFSAPFLVSAMPNATQKPLTEKTVNG